MATAKKKPASNGHGGARKGAGRKAGAISRATKQQKMSFAELAKRHADVALRVLVQVATAGESESARVAASKELLDRAYGKPTQGIEHTGADGGPIQTQDVSQDAVREEIAALFAEPSSQQAGGKGVVH